MIKRGYDWLSSREREPPLLSLYYFSLLFSLLLFLSFFFFLSRHTNLSVGNHRGWAHRPSWIANIRVGSEIMKRKKKKRKRREKDIARLQLQISRSFIYNAGIITPRWSALLLNSCNYYPFRNRSHRPSRTLHSWINKRDKSQLLRYTFLFCNNAFE